MNNEFKRMIKLAGLTEIKVNQPEKNRIRFGEFYAEKTPEYYETIKKYGDNAYHEIGLADDFKEIRGKKVKEILGYFEYNEENEIIEDANVIGYIFPISKKNIESYSEDELDNVFMDFLEYLKK